MLPYTELIQLAKEIGFQAVTPLHADTLEPNDEVRKMCKDCSAYQTRWSCPPACGTLEQCKQKLRRYHEGILVQTIRALEDEFDGEAMMQAEADHKENFSKLHATLRLRYPELLALGSGGCRLCPQCTYPEQPCRFPERMVCSMESFGILVLQVCKDNGLPYYYGSKTIAYTGCFLLE